MTNLGKHAALLYFLILGLTLTLACQERAKPDLEKKIESKVAPALRLGMAEIEQALANADTRKDLGLSRLSNSRVKIDDDGRIQCYLYLNSIDQEHIAALQNRGLHIDAMSERTKVVQVWLPYDRISEIGKLDFVARIAPPDYGTSL